MLYHREMNLADYLKAERGRSGQVARACGLLPSFISQISTGKRTPPVEHCAAIEAATGMCVRRWELRPVDWRRIWPELIDVPGAPGPLVDVAAAKPQAQPAVVCDAE